MAVDEAIGWGSWASSGALTTRTQPNIRIILSGLAMPREASGAVQGAVGITSCVFIALGRRTALVFLTD